MLPQHSATVVKAALLLLLLSRHFSQGIPPHKANQLLPLLPRLPSLSRSKSPKLPSHSPELWHRMLLGNRPQWLCLDSRHLSLTLDNRHLSQASDNRSLLRVPGRHLRQVLDSRLLNLRQSDSCPSLALHVH